MGPRLCKPRPDGVAIIGSVVGLALLLMGCASKQYDEGLTSDERLLREQSDSFVSENVFGGAAEGALWGCLAGGLLGAMIGGDASDAAIGCGAGAGVGAIAGGVNGYLQAKEAQHQADEVAMAQSIAADVRRDNENLRKSTLIVERVVAKDRERLEELQAQVSAKQITIDEARAEAEGIRDNSDTIESMLSAAQERRDDYVEVRDSFSGENKAEIDNEIKRLNNEIAQLEQQLTIINASLELTGLG